MGVLTAGPVRRFSPVDRRLRLVDDARHRGHGVRRIRPDAGLRGQHHRVRAVEHRIGHVGDLGSGRAPIGDHRVEHVSRDDDRLVGIAA